MKIFSVYLDKKNTLEKAVFVKNGFSLKAFIFSYLWFLFNRMWFIAIALFLLNAILFACIFNAHIDFVCYYVINLAITLYVGSSAMNLKEMSLISRGYKLKESIVAKDEAEAQLKFFNFVFSRLSNPEKR